MSGRLPAWVWGPWLGLVGAAVFGLAAPAVADRVQGWPLLVSLLVLGLPHGAADLVLARRLCGRWAGFLPYLGVMALTGLALWLAPAWAVAAFLAVTVVHFGRADAWDVAAVAGSSPGWLGWLEAVGRGAWVLAVPFAAHPAATAEVMRRVVRLLDTSADWPTVGSAWAAAVAVPAVALTVGVRATCRQWSVAWLHVVELGVIGLVGWTLPPLAAVGVYFLFWHAVRQSRRVIREAGPPRAGLGWLHAAAVPLWLPSLVAFAALGWWSVGPDPTGLAVLVLLLFAAVTPAHHLLAEAWRVRPAAASDATRVL